MRLNYSSGYYEGDVKYSKPHGYGKRVWDNGNVYEGNWKDGKYHGKGKFVWADGDVYEGNYYEGMRSGLGRYTYSNGNYYEGSFVNGVYSGLGKYFYKDGSAYEGNFQNDKREGYGRYVSADGVIYEGEWKGGKPDGRGKKTFPDGSFIDADWVGWQNATDAVRRTGSVAECGSVVNGEFVSESIETSDVERLLSAMKCLVGGDAEGFERSENFERKVSELTVLIINEDENENRSLARDSAERIAEAAGILSRLAARAEISLTKLSDAEYGKIRKEIKNNS